MMMRSANWDGLQNRGRFCSPTESCEVYRGAQGCRILCQNVPQSLRNGRTRPPRAPACSILSGSLVLPLRGIAWELGIVGGVVGPDGILQSCVILLLVVVSLCSVSGLHCDFARPCNPILVPFVLPPIVLPGFV